MATGGIREALAQPCVADTSVLSNFVQAGAAEVLVAVLDGPVRIPPTVLDPAEAASVLLTRPTRVPRSELLRQLQYDEDDPSRLRHDQAATMGLEATTARIEGFARSQGVGWLPVDPTVEELSLATRLSSRVVRAEVREACPELRKRRIELDAGEAEAVAIAVSRGWTILVDDQAAVDLLRCLYPTVPVVRTCQILVHAVQRGTVSCPDAARLFNEVMVGELGFFASRRGKRLFLGCDPLGCWFA